MVQRACSAYTLNLDETTNSQCFCNRGRISGAFRSLRAYCLSIVSLEIGPGVQKSQWLDTYKRMLAALPAGTYELIVHLAYDDEEIRGATSDHPDWGAEWRQNDLDMVRSPEFRQFLQDQGFIPISWKDLARATSE
jgi:hypothetical protein